MAASMIAVSNGCSCTHTRAGYYVDAYPLPTKWNRAMTTINNKIYDQIGAQWWSDDHFMALLRLGINPLRLKYIKQHIDRSIRPYHVLDIGCGAGFLCESLAKLDMTCTGLDKSLNTISVAIRHAEKSKLKIHYIHANAHNITLSPESFDMITCCDMLEHTNHPEIIIKEAARLLKPNGIFFYDTINRTLKSYISAIFISQNFPLTAFMPKDTHVWKLFIKPEECINMMRYQYLNHINQIGIGPSINAISIIENILIHKLGYITPSTLADKLAFDFTKNQTVSYMGHAIKK